MHHEVHGEHVFHSCDFDVERLPCQRFMKWSLNYEEVQWEEEGGEVVFGIRITTKDESLCLSCLLILYQYFVSNSDYILTYSRVCRS